MKKRTVPVKDLMEVLDTHCYTSDKIGILRDLGVYDDDDGAEFVITIKAKVKVLDAIDYDIDVETLDKQTVFDDLVANAPHWMNITEVAG